jgi:hypothetical protein
VSFVELCLNGDDIIWDNGIIEGNLDYEIVHFHKFASDETIASKMSSF